MSLETLIQDSELPMPLSFYTNLKIASRPTLYRWEKEGLKILHCGGRAYIKQSEITRFIEEKAEISFSSEKT